MINPKQLRELIVRPTLKAMNLWSIPAENLLMGTTAVESQCGTYIRQLGTGPAMGIFQMEPATFTYLVDRFKSMNEFNLLLQYCHYSQSPGAEAMIDNLSFAAGMCRLKYMTIPDPIPAAIDNIEGLADYWKKYYNTSLGAGTAVHFLAAYEMCK